MLTPKLSQRARGVFTEVRMGVMLTPKLSQRTRGVFTEERRLISHPKNQINQAPFKSILQSWHPVPKNLIIIFLKNND